MMRAVAGLDSSELELLAGELRSGRLRWPVDELDLSRWFDGQRAAELAKELGSLVGFVGPQVATLLEAIIEDRRQRNVSLTDVELVATSPVDGDGISRDTSAV